MQINENEWCDAAARLAKRLHQKQMDKAGFDYFEGHLSAVAKMGKTWQERVVGYLHDASEDTTHSVDEVITLLEKECSKSLSAEERATISTALSLLNHHYAPNRDYYIKAIAQNATYIQRLCPNGTLQSGIHFSAKPRHALQVTFYTCRTTKQHLD